MRAARGLVDAFHHVAVLDDGDTGGATADIHHGAIARTDEQICGRGLVKDGNHVEPRSLGDVFDNAAVKTLGSRRKGHGTGLKLAPELLLELFLELARDIDCTHVVDDHAVLDHTGKAIRAGHRLTRSVNHSEHDKCGAHVETAVQGLVGAYRARAAHTIEQILKASVGSLEINHGAPPLRPFPNT